ncbi:DNA polymerase delta subunit 2 [Malassezia pachydermatis]
MPRAAAAYEALSTLSDPLRIPASERSYARQFAQMYDYRLAALRRRVYHQAESYLQDRDVTYVKRILDIPPKRTCLIIGTFYCHMPLKPDVLQDIARDVRAVETDHSSRCRRLHHAQVMSTWRRTSAS